jgi:hypothetical protein
MEFLNIKLRKNPGTTVQLHGAEEEGVKEGLLDGQAEA